MRPADLILSSVDDGLFELCVSDHLLAEIERVLIDHKGLSADKAKIFREAVEANAQILTPDEFYARLLLAGFADDVVETVHRISSKLRNPPRSPSEILAGLEHIGLSETVAHLRNHTGATQLGQRTQARGLFEHADAYMCASSRRSAQRRSALRDLCHLPVPM